MPSEIIRGRATTCCSLMIHTSAARCLCNAPNDWVGSCAITIKRQHNRTPCLQSRTLAPPLRSRDREARATRLGRFVELARSCHLPVHTLLHFFAPTTSVGGWLPRPDGHPLAWPHQTRHGQEP